MSRDGCVALPRGAMGLSSVCDCGIFCSYSLFLKKKLEPDLDPNCSSLYPVSTYYIRNQATGVSLARDGMLARYSCNLVMMTKQYAEKRISMQNVKNVFLEAFQNENV